MLSTFLVGPFVFGQDSAKDILKDATHSESPGEDPAEHLKSAGASLEGGFLSDSYSSILTFGVNFDYSFKTRHALELQIKMNSAKDNDVVSFYSALLGIPDHNIPQGFYGLNYVWTPFSSQIDAKMWVLGHKSVSWDMSFAPGLGVTPLKSATFASPPNYVVPNIPGQMAITGSVDISQRFYFLPSWALKVTWSNHAYSETFYSAETGSSLRSRITLASSLLLGISYSCRTSPESFSFKNCF